ncbi:MAG: DedA family protein [Deltaproteobacteria bacterium]|nr:MAG: DedA family protein [Deltaproteobacteria bacterium]
MIESIANALHQIYDVEGIVRWGGLVMLTTIIFAETGLLIGFFLPGDLLLVTAGLLASPGQRLMNIGAMAVILPIAAIAGNSCGYYVGKATGPRLFRREDSLLFNKKHLYRAHAFYEKHGGKTLVLARFMPIVRTFVPVVAGMAAMDFATFTLYNVIGGVLWILSMLFLGYFIGDIPWVRQNVEKVILIVIFLSILPGIIEYVRSRGRETEPPL